MNSYGDEGNHFKPFSLIADVNIPSEFVVLRLESYLCSTEVGEKPNTSVSHWNQGPGEAISPKKLPLDAALWIMWNLYLCFDYSYLGIIFSFPFRN